MRRFRFMTILKDVIKEIESLGEIPEIKPHQEMKLWEYRLYKAMDLINTAKGSCTPISSLIRAIGILFTTVSWCLHNEIDDKEDQS